MGVVLEILQALGLTSAPPAPTTTAEARNVLRYPVTALPVVSGALAHTSGGLASDNSLRPRVSVIVGPGATIRGAAETVLPLFSVASGPAPPTLDQLAAAIVVYSTQYLPASSMANWKVGLRLPLPIEIDTTTNPNTPTWVVNSDSIRQWAAQFVPGASDPRTLEAADLDQPDADTLETDATNYISAQGSLSALSADMYAKALTNPFDEVFMLFAVFAQLGGDAVQVALGLTDELVDHEFSLLGTLTAGAAILRRIRTLLANATLTQAQQASAQRATQLISAALVQTAANGQKTAVVPREVPETASQLTSRGSFQELRDSPDDPTGGLHRRVLGRDVAVGKIISYSGPPEFVGPSFAGRISPTVWLTNNVLLVNPTSDPTKAARLTVIEGIAGNEGWLDAIRLADRGIVSSGIQQWSAHAPKELASLLYRFAQSAPDEFDLFFGLYGLGVQATSTDGEYDWLKTGADGVTQTPMTHWSAIFAFFGGTVVGGVNHFDTTWAGRFRLASIASAKYRLAQAAEAMARFDRIASEIPEVTVGGKDVDLTDLVTAQKFAALVLDAHINAPGNVQGNLNSAGQHVTTTDPVQREQTVMPKYETIRQLASKSSRDTLIDHAGFSTTSGSFGGW